MKNQLDIGNLKQHYDKLMPEEKAVRLSAFYSILYGKPATICDLSFRTSLPEAQVKRCVERLEKSGALVIDKEGSVVGSHGLSIIPTEHSLFINGNSLFTWCAADAVGIPAALEMDAEILSNCRYCGESVKISMIKGNVEYSNHKDIQVWVVEADLGRSIVECT